MKTLNLLTILLSLASAHTGTDEAPTINPNSTSASQPQQTAGYPPPFNFTGTSITFPPLFNINGTNTTVPHPPEQPRVYRGFSLGAWNGGQNQPVKNSSDWANAFSRIKGVPGGFNSARTYAVEGVLPNILAAANETGVHVLVGLYLGSHDGGARFNTEFAVLKEAVGQYGFDHIIGITVGNEDLYRGTAPPSLVADEIKQVQSWLDSEYPDACVRVGHVDTWAALLNATSSPVTAASDFLVANIFPYWEDAPLHLASSYFNSALQNITAFEEKQGIEVWIGETGWPYAHPAEGKPGVVNGKQSLQRYWTDVVCSEGFQGRNAFYYIDCDGGDQPEWGVYGLDGEARVDRFECGPV